MPHSQPRRSQTQLGNRSNEPICHLILSQQALPSFLAHQAVVDILQELVAGRLADKDARYFVKNCLQHLTPGDKEFLTLFRWRVEAVPLRGKPTIPILPHILSFELREAIISDILHFRSWSLLNHVDWENMSDELPHIANLVFQRLRQTVSFVAGHMGVEILTWDE